MPEVLDWQSADPRTVRFAARLLHAGRLVAFPTDTAYTLAASALDPSAVDRLCGATRHDGVEVAVGGPGEARDWLVDLGGLGRRLARRLWPGPLTLASADGGERGLARRLPEPVRRQVAPGGALRLRAPGHPALLQTLRHLSGPVVLAPVALGAQDQAVRPEQVWHSAGAAVDLIVDDGPTRLGGPATVVGLKGNTWDVLQAGVLSEEQLRQQAVCLIVFVCTGNTCRSPLAEALCKKRLADRLGCAAGELPARGLLVTSAGVAAAAGGPAADEAVEVARAYGADLAGHQSRPLTPELAAQADYLVAMTRGHVRALYERYPRLGAVPRQLSPNGDLADPISQSQAVYEECGRQIWRHLEGLVAELGR
jgi:protein-tyrosine phosphatase